MFGYSTAASTVFLFVAVLVATLGADGTCMVQARCFLVVLVVAILVATGRQWLSYVNTACDRDL